jgi:hypothetical protein
MPWERQPRKQPNQRSIKYEAVQDMREAVGIQEVLRTMTAMDVPPPQIKLAARAPPNSSLPAEFGDDQCQKRERRNASPQPVAIRRTAFQPMIPARFQPSKHLCDHERAPAPHNEMRHGAIFAPPTSALLNVSISFVSRLRIFGGGVSAVGPPPRFSVD